MKNRCHHINRRCFRGLSGLLPGDQPAMNRRLKPRIQFDRLSEFGRGFSIREHAVYQCLAPPPLLLGCRNERLIHRMSCGAL